MMVRVAGFNCDIESISNSRLDTLTCETIAASYARISRDPRPILEIRRDARENVKKARELNRRVVFDMGHASIAEHAVFNLDIIGVSRLAAEYIERFRLVSYTEKSQRYIKLDEDFVIPQEIPEDLRDEYVRFVKASFELYERIYQEILPSILKEKNPFNDELKKRDIEGLAMEDARYILPLSVTTQLGLTANARNIEHIIKVLASSPYFELQSVAAEILRETTKYAPSLIRYTEPEEYYRRHWYTPPQRMEILRGEINYSIPGDGVKLLSIDGDIDDIIALQIFESEDTGYEEARGLAKGLSIEDKRNKIYEIFKGTNKHHQLPRIFERINLEYELVMSASCYAQFKRHRMMTQIPQQYSFELGFEIPPLVRKSGFVEVIERHIRRATELYNKIFEKNPFAAPYVILNGHRRRVYAKLNAREIYHLSRLRMDHHAQWEIQRLVTRMVENARLERDFIFDLCCGKDVFDELKGRIFK
jgi:flavin-dependent thymidylate synthase